MTSVNTSLYETAREHCCSKCRSYFKTSDRKEDESNHKNNVRSHCWLCLGLWQEGTENDNANNNSETTTSCLQKALEDCCGPYGGIGGNSPNRFSQQLNQSHTVSLSGDLCLRYRWLASSSTSSVKPVPFSTYLQDLKQHIHGRIERIIQKGGCSDSGIIETEKSQQWAKYHWQIFEEEEQGSLSIHILCLPPKNHPMNNALNHYMNNYQDSQKTKKQRKRYNKRQKCGPFITQGGDPRQNLEVRLRSKGHEWISQSTAEDLSSSAMSATLSSIIIPNEVESFNKPSMMAEYHVAVFRRPIFLYGYYTKSRRDVSQSPFVVMREKPSPAEPPSGSTDKSSVKKEAETLGVTSVEEQICGPIQDLLGISTQNNLESDSPSNNSGGVLYGMIKFHASGREDMDVRMLIRPDSPTCHGRPFCVQIIDALKPIVSQEQLQGLMETINHEKTESSTTASTKKGAPSTRGISYGQNPMGVGISSDAFRPVPAAVFSGLQMDTESKTKHYGCYCWSKNALPDVDDLTKFIFGKMAFPLPIQQRTPFRVLHRRTNSVRERNILHARATKIDDHHFRLELSTQAGTYVKEFVHGDFGRTIPSVSSLMDCKTNLLQLDCEGIEIPTVHV